MKYPTQYEAQTIIDAIEALDGLSLAGFPETETATIIRTARQAMSERYAAVLDTPDQSPWRVQIKRGKRVLYWDHDSVASKIIMKERVESWS